MDGNNQIVPIAFGICKGETGPCWSWWMSVLKECIGDNPNLLFISDRHAAIALAVQNKSPLTYHVVCCRHLMMNLSLKRDKTKALFCKICKAYTTEEFSSSMSHLQNIQPDAYDKLCQVGSQRWSRAHCPLVCYNYLTSNSMESVNACTVVYRKLPVIKLAETYHAMVQDWFTSPPRRSFVGGLVATVDPVELERFSTNQSMADSANDARKTIVANLQRELEAEATLANTMLGNLTRYFEQMRIREIQITMLQNMPTMSLNSYGLHALLMTHEADIRTTNNLNQSKDQLVEKHYENLAFKHMDSNLNIFSLTPVASSEEPTILKINYPLYTDGPWFTDRRVEINNLMVLQDHPLIDYSKYALGCMTGADMKKCVHLKSVRDELLRSMKEKRQLMTNYRDM
ncbi:transposase, MuDR, MULE transposase domain protein [Tanacetum coccineum]